MIWQLLSPIFFRDHGDGGGSGNDDDPDDNDPGDGDGGDGDSGLGQDIVDYLKSKGIDASEASSTQIADAIWAKTKEQDTKLKDEIKGRQTERQRRQDLQKKLDTPVSLTELLGDSKTDDATKGEIRSLIEKASGAVDLEEAISLLVDNGTISNELYEVLQAGPKATAAALKAIGKQTGGQSSDSPTDATDDLAEKVLEKIMGKLGTAGADLHQTKGTKGKGKPKTLLEKYLKEDPNTKKFIENLQSGGKKK